jgi:hypothetical protein
MPDVREEIQTRDFTVLVLAALSRSARDFFAHKNKGNS